MSCPGIEKCAASASYADEAEWDDDTW